MSTVYKAILLKSHNFTELPISWEHIWQFQSFHLIDLMRVDTQWSHKIIKKIPIYHILPVTCQAADGCVTMLQITKLYPRNGTNNIFYNTISQNS